MLVGITEEIGDFIAILEATIPRIFKGATKLFNEGKLCYHTRLQCRTQMFDQSGRNMAASFLVHQCGEKH